MSREVLAENSSPCAPINGVSKRGITRSLGLAVLAASLLIGAHTTPAHAADSIVFSGTARATSNVGTSIVSGDTFSWSFALNPDAAVDLNASTFNSAVTSFNLTAGAGNVGTWSPAGVNWLISPVFNLVTNQWSDQMTLQVKASNAPQINGVNLFDLSITADWNPAVVNVQAVSGTLGSTLGTNSPDTSAASYYFQLRDTNYSSASFVASASVRNDSAQASTSTSSASTPVFDLALVDSPGINCSSPRTSAMQGSWVQLPAATSCTPPAGRSGSTLLGWSTSPAFPVDVAQGQMARGWGAIDAIFGGQRMIFIPAGGHTLVSGGNMLYPVWGS